MPSELEERMAEIARIQSETAGRVHTMGEVLVRPAGRACARGVRAARRGDAPPRPVDADRAPRTRWRTCSKLNERLAVIDSAQKNITDLASQVTSLREVLANKQARGAFGQGRMEAIVQDGLPKGAYEFQYTLSNGKRPDCAVFLPNDERPLVIDAKFPLEAITRAARRAQRRASASSAAQRAAPGRDAGTSPTSPSAISSPARRRTSR